MTEILQKGTGFLNTDGSGYSNSFGALPDKTVYQKVDPTTLLKGQVEYEVDLTQELNEFALKGMQILKADTTQGGAGTAGYAMIPVYLDPKIIDTTRKRLPARTIIPRVTNIGITADYNNLITKGGAATAAEDATLTEADDTYDRYSTSIKYLYAVGKITGPANRASVSFVLSGMTGGNAAFDGFGDSTATNGMQREVIVKARSLAELEENLIFNGNATTSGISGNPNGTEFDGIITLMGSTNTVDKNTSAITLSDFDTAAQYAYDDGGNIDVMFCSSAVYTDVKDLLQAKIGFLQTAVTTQWGFSVLEVNTLHGTAPLIPSMYLSNTSGSKSVYMLDLSVCEIRVLQDATYEKLAKTNDSDKFMIKAYETFIIRNTSFCASITEIS